MSKDSVLQNFESHLQTWAAQHFHKNDDLHAACRYALAGEGKRVRPLLVFLSGHITGASYENALPAAIAVEMVHTYSLVHDDLPAMDNDDLRRGRPTLHKKFDEATALLAGDALLTDAFQVLSDPSLLLPLGVNATLEPRQRLAMVRELSRGAGGLGMVWGQMLDMFWTAKQGASEQDLNAVHIHKTGKLIAAACAMGALSGSPDDYRAALLARFGEKIGLAFQIVDDLLDNSTETGKSTGKDADQGKLTYLALMNRAEASAKADRLTAEAEQLLRPFGSQAADLIKVARTLLQRRK